MIFREKLSSFLIYSVTIMVFLGLVIFVQPQNFLENLVQLGGWELFIIIFLYILDLLIRVFRWKILLYIQGFDYPSSSLLMPVASALAINLFTIARAGEAVRLYTLKRKYGTKYSETLSSIVIEQFFSIIGLLFVIFTSLFFLSSSTQPSEDSIIIVQLITFLLFGSLSGLIVLIIIYFRPDFITRYLHYFPNRIAKRITAMFSVFQSALLDLRSKPSLMGLSVFLSSCVWIIEGLILYAIAAVVFPYPFGFTDLPWVIAASGIGNITFIIPLLPGAMGEYELVVALILINSPNYPGIDATLIALLDRTVKSIILLLLGGYATVKLGGTELLRLKEEAVSSSEF